MIICMFLLATVIIGLLLGMWQDLRMSIDAAITDLEDELKFSPDHATQYDNTDTLLDVSFDVYANDYMEEVEDDGYSIDNIVTPADLF